eukprot:jgi/Galph1/642/GphlegSOOS_G5302.1
MQIHDEQTVSETLPPRETSVEQSFESTDSIERLLRDLPGPDEGFLLATLEASSKSIPRPPELGSLDFSQLRLYEDSEEDNCGPENEAEPLSSQNTVVEKEEVSRTSGLSKRSTSSSKRRRRRSRSFLNSPRAGSPSVSLARDLELLYDADTQTSRPTSKASKSSPGLIDSLLRLLCLNACTVPVDVPSSSIGNNSFRKVDNSNNTGISGLNTEKSQSTNIVDEDKNRIRVSIKKQLVASSTDNHDESRQGLEKGLTRLASLPLLKRRNSRLLPSQSDSMKGRKTLVLDLDETLVHTSFEDEKHEADFTLNLNISDVSMTLYVRKRPWCDEFLQKVSEVFEVIIFTASLPAYADPVIDMLCDSADLELIPPERRLFRDSCEYDTKQSGYVKKLSLLGRDLAKTVIVDNSPTAYAHNMDNAIPIGSFVNDMNDHELLNILPWLLSLSQIDDVREKIRQRREIFSKHSDSLKAEFKHS